MEGFLEGSPIPATMDEFLDKFEQGNHLKSDYLLNIDNTDSAIRVNYNSGNKIFEIKILHKIYENTRLDIVIVDDITQIKDDERRQKDLAANVSHELKTPLTVIRASELFINNITPDNMPSYEQIKTWGTRVVTNAVRMQDIVQDFLTLSMCQDKVPMTIVDIGQIIGRAVSSVAEYPGRRDTDTLRFDEEKTEGGIGQYIPESEDATIAVMMSVSHVTPTGLTVHFTQYDKRDCGELIYGEGYHLEVLNGDTWEDVPTIIEDWGFNSIGYTIPAEGEAKIETNWEWLYGKLSPGTYRITKILTDSSRNDPNVMIPAYPLTAQFMIAGDEL